MEKSVGKLAANSLKTQTCAADRDWPVLPQIMPTGCLVRIYMPKTLLAVRCSAKARAESYPKLIFRSCSGTRSRIIFGVG